MRGGGRLAITGLRIVVAIAISVVVAGCASAYGNPAEPSSRTTSVVASPPLEQPAVDEPSVSEVPPTSEPTPAAELPPSLVAPNPGIGEARQDDPITEKNNLPAWIGNILTGVSFSLGAFIVLRDWLHRKRRQAERVVVWQEANLIGQIVVHVRNASDMPIFRPRVHPITSGGVVSNSRLRSPHDPDTLEPGGYISRKVRHAGAREMRVIFTGADGKVWARDAISGKLKSARNVPISDDCE